MTPLSLALENFCHYINGRNDDKFKNITGSVLGQYKRVDGIYYTHYKLLTDTTKKDWTMNSLYESLVHILKLIDQENMSCATFTLFSNLVKYKPKLGDKSADDFIEDIKLAIFKAESKYKSDDLVIYDTQPSNVDQTSLNNVNSLNWDRIESSAEYYDICVQFERKSKKLAQLNSYKSHIEKKTTPKQLFYHNFPPPYLQHDDEFVKDYNHIISKTQVEIMQLCMNRLQHQIDLAETIATESLNKLRLSDNDRKIVIDRVKTKTDSKLKSYYAEVIDKASKCVAMPFETVTPKKNSPSSASDFDQSSSQKQSNTPTSSIKKKQSKNRSSTSTTPPPQPKTTPKMSLQYGQELPNKSNLVYNQPPKTPKTPKTPRNQYKSPSHVCHCQQQQQLANSFYRHRDNGDRFNYKHNSQNSHASNTSRHDYRQRVMSHDQRRSNAYSTPYNRYHDSRNHSKGVSFKYPVASTPETYYTDNSSSSQEHPQYFEKSHPKRRRYH